MSWPPASRDDTKTKAPPLRTAQARGGLGQGTLQPAGMQPCFPGVNANQDSRRKTLTWAVIFAVAAAAATAAAGGRPPGVAGVRSGMGGVTALPTRRYWPPRSKRFMEETASCEDWAFSYSTTRPEVKRQAPLSTRQSRWKWQALTGNSPMKP